MLENLIRMLAKQLHREASSITADSRIKEDLGADSLDILQLLMTVEEDYGITIPDEKLATFTTVGDVAVYLDSLKKS